MSIEENIRAGNPTASEEQIESVINASGCEEYNI